MKNKFPAVLALLLVLLAPTATRAGANPGAGDVIKSAGVIDCTPQGVSWTEWKYIASNTGAGKICGDPGVASANVRTLDNASDGQCISIFYRYSAGGLIYRHTPTTACGVGIVKAATMPGAVWDVMVGRHPTGTTSWGSVNAWRFLCWPDDGC